MFQVCEKPCDQCLFSKDRIVSAARVREILAGCARDDAHFICHKATIEGRDVCCRTFNDTRDSQMIRIAQRFNAIEFVDPATGKAIAPAPNSAAANPASVQREKDGGAS